jgi:hypothetical protein
MNSLKSLSGIIFLFITIQLLPSISRADNLMHPSIKIVKLEPSFAKIDSGFFDKVAKGYKIATNIGLDNLGEIASIVIMNKNKTMDNITKDVSTYLNQLGEVKTEIKKIKINKNTKIYIKRSS